MKELYTKPESMIDEFKAVSVLTASEIDPDTGIQPNEGVDD